MINLDGLTQVELFALYGAVCIRELKLHEESMKPVWIPPTMVYQITLNKVNQSDRLNAMLLIRSFFNYSPVKVKELIDSLPCVLLEAATDTEKDSLINQAKIYNLDVEVLFSNASDEERNEFTSLKRSYDFDISVLEYIEPGSEGYWRSPYGCGYGYGYSHAWSINEVPKTEIV